MPLSWNEIKNRALKFSHEWANESSEDAEAKSFWDAFFDVFGVPRRRVATFEQPVRKSDDHGGYIDLLWKGIVLVEHKSRGKDLDRAFQQAKNYFPGLKDRDLPRYIIVSDFARFRLYDLDEGGHHEFEIKEFYKNVRLFGFIAGYVTKAYKEQDPVNIQAAEKMGQLHDKLKDMGYEGHELEVYLVRLLFCLFADDTSIFERRQFQDLIEQRTQEDGQDLAQWLGHLFEVLNTAPDKRLKRLDEQLADFRYVNGNLFAEHLRTADFDKGMREVLLECCALDWSRISPAIFGALFQSVMKPTLRRNLGAHYTSEKNILKVIEPLFLEDLRAEFETLKRQPKKLMEFHERIAKLKFLDPACGCGNFLVIAYRELRLLELEVLRALQSRASTLSLDVALFSILCDVDQFYGIEIEEFPAQIAQTALWLIDHQMNMRVSEEFGNYFARLPLKKSATIVHDNALTRDWRTVVAPADLNFILGNPPFGGKQLQNSAQKLQLARVFSGIKSAGVLDFVAPWYKLAVEYMAENPSIKTGFVSTNSITQGEQVGVLWPDLIRRGANIYFAHRTFEWTSEARGKAAVHCVIIGFGLNDYQNKRLFDYDSVKSEAHEVKAKNINPYLVDAPNLFLENRRSPICEVPPIVFGSMANDGGHLLLSDEEKQELVRAEPSAAKWIRPFMQVDEFLYNSKRWCLWLEAISPSELKRLPLVSKRVLAVKRHRENSVRETTNNLSAYPTLFGEIRQPKSDYFIVPRHTGEDRKIIPIAKFRSNVICGDANLLIPNPSSFVFGVLQSTMHMAWVRSVCGRIKSDYRYSAGIVYNNFPWPQGETSGQRVAIEAAAQGVLDARASHPNSTLSDLYGSLTMPPDLAKAHRKLDLAVDAAYSKRKFTSDSERVSFLFEQYQKIVRPLEVVATSKKGAARKANA